MTVTLNLYQLFQRNPIIVRLTTRTHPSKAAMSMLPNVAGGRGVPELESECTVL